MKDFRIAPRPDIFFSPGWWLTCNVNILIVTDGSSSGGFGPSAGFHLGQVLNILSDDPWSHINFRVTKAHRQTETTADISNFRFDKHDLSRYSQIWLFGILPIQDALSQVELKALTQFMDQGGGVFATGDHENLGQAMCAEVPRVRSMRRWYYPKVGPNGEPVAPAQTSATTQHDTIMDTNPAVAGLQGSQSDKVPQPIRTEPYTRRSGSGIIHRVHKYPHPVLCGPEGVIEYLPDHMHEGLCEVPSDLSKSYTFDGYTSEEYRTVGGHLEKPEVIAWATTRNTTNREFGVLAAYDGHKVGVGRVLVDATWHHWFNINLIGFINATNPMHTTYDEAIIPKWEAIKAYFRNVGAWLARPSLQNCLRNGGLLISIKYYDILMTYKDLKEVPDKLTYYWQLGVFARDALGRLSSQCQSTQWVIDNINWFEFHIEPWIRKPPLPDPPPWLDISELEAVALGGTVHALVEAFGQEKEAQPILDRREKDVYSVARRGAAAAVVEWGKHYVNAAGEANKIIQLAQRHI